MAPSGLLLLVRSQEEPMTLVQNDISKLSTPNSEKALGQTKKSPVWLPLILVLGPDGRRSALSWAVPRWIAETSGFSHS